MLPLRIGLIGDFTPAALAHQAIPKALDLAGRAAGVDVAVEWLPTDALGREAAAAEICDALWAVPATPYRDTDAALAAIRHARESGTPFLGTCGGFQHAVIEYARTVLGLDAAHAETDADAALTLIAPLSCSLVEVTGAIRLVPGTRTAALYGRTDIVEGYHCNYGLSLAHAALFDRAPWRVSGRDADGDVRALELDGHPFYVITLFQPERAALRGETPPLAAGLVRAAADARRTTRAETR